MSAITGKKDLEERREQFYQAQQCKQQSFLLLKKYFIDVAFEN